MRCGSTARVLLLACATLLAAAGAGAAQERELLQRAATDRAKGVQGAPVLVYEIADFQCPYCARFSREVFPKLDSAYVKTGKVQWVFVNLPLPSHPRAWVAAEAALCAGGVADRFWSMHDRLFVAQEEWGAVADPTNLFVRYAREAGIPVEPFRACVLTDRVASLLLEDVVFSASARVSGTPTFIIDREQTVVGLKSYEEWRELLEEALQKKSAGQP